MAVSTYARVLKDRRTKNLTARLRPGDIALISHADLDTTAARALRDCRVSAVVNAEACITGRYPNRGPDVLLDANIPVLDCVGEDAFNAIADGQQAFLLEDGLKLASGACYDGTRLTRELVDAQLKAAQANLSDEMDHFARNTLEFLATEKSLLFDPIDPPRLKTKFENRHVLIVVRGEGYKEDLAMLGDYLRDVRPVLLAVDGGADALLEVKLRPDVILGDMDSVSDAALRCGAELVVHGYATGAKAAPGLERMKELGLNAAVFHSPGTSEDVAMLLAGRARRKTHCRGRDAFFAGRVSGQRASGHGKHLPDPPANRFQTGGRQRHCAALAAASALLLGNRLRPFRRRHAYYRRAFALANGQKPAARPHALVSASCTQVGK